MNVGGLDVFQIGRLHHQAVCQRPSQGRGAQRASAKGAILGKPLLAAQAGKENDLRVGVAAMNDLPEHVRKNRAKWDDLAKEYAAAGERGWVRDTPVWGKQSCICFPTN